MASYLPAQALAQTGLQISVALSISHVRAYVAPDIKSDFGEFRRLFACVRWVGSEAKTTHGVLRSAERRVHNIETRLHPDRTKGEEIPEEGEGKED